MKGRWRSWKKKGELQGERKVMSVGCFSELVRTRERVKKETKKDDRTRDAKQEKQENT